MNRGRGAHYVPRVKDRDKREVSFSLVPSNLGKKGKVCSYSARLMHNQVLDEDAVVSEMREEFNLPKNRVLQNLQQISDYLVSRIKKGYQVTFGGFTVGLSISGKFDAMNAEFDPEKNKVEVVVTPRYELTDAVAYLKPVNETKNTSRPELFVVICDGVNSGRDLNRITAGSVCHLNGSSFTNDDGRKMVDAVWLEDASGKTVAEATIIKYDATRMDLRFDGEIAAGPYQIVLRRMNADGKSYALARLKVEVVA